MSKKMTDRQKRFCDEYLIDLNATQAAIRAGYSKKYVATNTTKLLTNTNVKNYLAEKMQEIQSSKIATAEEVIEYLTSVMRGKQDDSDSKDRIKAAELLGKTYGIYTDKMKVTASIPVFKGDDELED